MNAKIVKTRKALLDALVDLLEEAPIECISVSKLCQKANINRTTFYKYYSVPADVILEAADEMMMQTIKVNEGALQQRLLAVCNAFYENRKMVILYTKSTGNLFQMFHAVLMRHSGELSFLSSSENHFLAGGVSSVLAAWMIRGFPESPEEMAQMLTAYIRRITGEEA